jgi:hypothetical protein
MRPLLASGAHEQKHLPSLDDVLEMSTIPDSTLSHPRASTGVFSGPEKVNRAARRVDLNKTPVWWAYFVDSNSSSRYIREGATKTQ